jgi:hypothetical protein
MPAKLQPGHPGDRIEVCCPGREAPRRGLIVEVVGGSAHERYRVRWRDGRESIHYPSDGTRIRSRELSEAASPELAWDQPARAYADHFRG